MTRNKFLHWIFILQMMFLIAGCGSIPGFEDPQQYIIDVIGTPIVLNCSKSYTFAGHYANEEHDTVRVAVSAGDLMYFLFMGDEILCYRYNPSDGANLAIRFDSIYERFYLNEEVISVRLEEGSKAWDWLAEHDEVALTGIRSFNISLPLSETEINTLKIISGSISNPGLFIEGDSLLEEVLSIINPGWLIAEDLDYRILSDEAISSLKNLELLWYSGEDSIDHEFLYGLPRLNSLILEYWDSTAITDLQFNKLKNLESLSIIESDIHDLSPIAALSTIRNLNLIYCETLKEIGSLADLARITCLGLTGCQNINDIPVILQMPPLTRLSIPGNTTQQEFSDIISRHDMLQVLDLVNCDSITDLSPLGDFTGLKALTLDFNIPDLKPVYQLTGLELLVLPEEFFEDSNAIAEIQQAMPDTRIVTGGGFCLGSGWVLLLIPAIISLIILRKKYTESRDTMDKR